MTPVVANLSGGSTLSLGNVTLAGGSSSAPAPVAASAPVDLVAVPGVASAKASWSAPRSPGSFPISMYQVQAIPGGAGCLVPVSETSCTIKGLTDGQTYGIRVQALTGAGWGAWSESVSVAPEVPVAPSILISGARAEIRGKPGIVITGTTSGLGMGAILRPWMRFSGQAQSTEGSAQILVDESGAFTWQRRTGKKVSVVVATDDGALRSNRVTIR